MPAELMVYAADGPELSLGEVMASNGEIGEGEPTLFYARNVGTTNLRQIEIALPEQDEHFVQLARDEDGKPGVWADLGQPINPFEGVLRPDEVFSFWARAYFRPEDAEGRRDFDIAVRTVSG